VEWPLFPSPLGGEGFLELWTSRPDSDPQSFVSADPFPPERDPVFYTAKSRPAAPFVPLSGDLPFSPPPLVTPLSAPPPKELAGPKQEICSPSCPPSPTWPPSILSSHPRHGTVAWLAFHPASLISARLFLRLPLRCPLSPPRTFETKSLRGGKG